MSAIFLQVTSPLYVEDLYATAPVIAFLLEKSPSVTDDVADRRESDVRQLFEAVRELSNMFSAFCPS